MKSLGKNWYKEIWTLDIKTQSWVENTVDEVDFMIQELELTGKERILDMACGFGRHSLEFARRGFEVVGVDITEVYIEDAIAQAEKEQLTTVSFRQADIRDLTYEEEFDVVLNLADGAIGYLENEEENHKIFTQISKALRHGGKHFMEVGNAEYADHYFPRHNWEIGEKSLALSKFEWDREKRIYLFGAWDFYYGEEVKKPEFEYGAPQRIYSLDEIETLLEERGMKVIHTFSDYYGNASSFQEFQLMVHSVKSE